MNLVHSKQLTAAAKIVIVVTHALLCSHLISSQSYVVYSKVYLTQNTLKTRTLQAPTAFVYIFIRASVIYSSLKSFNSPTPLHCELLENRARILKFFIASASSKCPNTKKIMKMG